MAGKLGPVVADDVEVREDSLVVHPLDRGVVLRYLPVLGGVRHLQENLKFSNAKGCRK